VLQIRRICVLLRNPPLYLDWRWTPTEAQTLALRGLQQPHAGKDETAALRGKRLLQDMIGPGGRPAGSGTDWPQTRFTAELATVCRRFSQTRGRPATQAEAARTMGDQPIDTFRWRFRKYVQVDLAPTREYDPLVCASWTSAATRAMCRF
jgi:hypothetical protein